MTTETVNRVATPGADSLRQSPAEGQTNPKLEGISLTIPSMRAPAEPQPTLDGWEKLRRAAALAAGRADRPERIGPEVPGMDRRWRLGLRALRSRIVAITSGKGGVGKSNVASGLAILLSAAGASVALIDADIGLGNLDVLMGVPPGPTLSDVLSGERTLEEILVKLPCGVRLAAGSTSALAGRLDDRFGQDELLAGVARLRGRHDFVIVDCGSGLGPEVIKFCRLADRVLVVTTPEPTALADAYGMIKSLSLSDHAARLSVLVNMASGRQEAKAAYTRIASVAGRFLGKTIYDAGYVLSDPKVPAAVRRREPFVLAYPRCPASRSLAAHAAKLRPWSNSAAQSRRVGLFGRVASWIGGSGRLNSPASQES